MRPSARTPSRRVLLNSPSVAAWSLWLIGRPYWLVPAAVGLELVVDQRVHRPHVDGELEALAVPAHAGRRADRVAPFLGLPEPAQGGRPGQTAGLHEQVGRSGEPVSADQRQLQQYVVAAAPEPAERPRSPLDEIEVHPVRNLVDDREELAQRLGRLDHGVDPLGEGTVELRHGDPLGVVLRQAHRLDQPRAEFVAGEHPPAQPVEQSLIHRRDPRDDAQRAGQPLVALARAVEPVWVDQGVGVDSLSRCALSPREHVPMVTRIITRVQLA